MADSPVLFKTITNRLDESTKLGKEWRITILQRVANNSCFPKLSASLQTLVKTYLQQGAYYVEPVPEVLPST
jgi:hypothetical protein